MVAGGGGADRRGEVLVEGREASGGGAATGGGRGRSGCLIHGFVCTCSKNLKKLKVWREESSFELVISNWRENIFILEGVLEIRKPESGFWVFFKLPPWSSLTCLPAFSLTERTKERSGSAACGLLKKFRYFVLLHLLT